MMKRRSFIQFCVSAPLLASVAGQAGAANAVPQNTIVVLDAIDAATDADRLTAVLRAFAAKGLPATCLVDPSVTRESRLTPDHPVAQVLRKHRREKPGLIELAPVVPALGQLTPYFQARAAYEAKARLIESIWGPDHAALQDAELKTIAGDMMDQARAPSGLRSAGVRNVLMRPETTQPVQPEAWDYGIARLLGGQRVSLDAALDESAGATAPTVERVLYLSASDFADLPITELEAQAAAFAERVAAQDGQTWASPILASDIQFRDYYGYRRSVGLHFLQSDSASAEDQQALTDFRMALMDAGLPSSFGVQSSDALPTTDLTGYWIDVEGDLKADLPFMPVAPAVNGAPVTTLDPLGSEATTYGAAIDLTESGSAGLDGTTDLIVPGFQVSTSEQIAELSGATLATRDFAVVISADMLRDQPNRAALQRALLALSDDGITDIKTLPDYVRSMIPYGPYLTHARRTKTYQHRPAPAPTPLSETSRTALIEDAEIAWGYFDKWTNRETGLCPATVNFSDGGRRLHETVTMWDVGSHLNALMAALELGLISDKTFQRSTDKILANIIGRRSQGRLLPQGWIATDRFKWGVKDFDGCDAGRLMSALYNLASHRLAPARAVQIATDYDLDAVVQDGIIYSVQDGALESTIKSHCAHYAAWSFRTWGIEVRSPYEVFQGRTEMDSKMALLEVAGQIGPMGAEPLLLEALELGMSAESAYLAEVLFAAQLEEYHMSGALMSVSEGPIDRAPWFTYQGLQFDAQGRVWATDTVDGLPEHRSKAFREKNLVVSSKAAYLWAAYKNHPYCDALISHVRDRARTSNGFASSIYLQTQTATRTYSDLNTNGIILQSIAEILKDTPSNQTATDG